MQAKPTRLENDVREEGDINDRGDDGGGRCITFLAMP
jgi:hypothetical protein